jgi:hypothetical protein
MPFDATFIHWPSITAFAAYLQTVPRPSWCRRLCHHNTYIPNETQWHGMASMDSMRATYIAKGWSAGPHLYLAAAAPDPADTGIWQMTPLAHMGVHAGACNATDLGIESVGDFNARPPTKEQYTLLITVTILILSHWGIPPSAVEVHRECMTGRTCPGKFLSGPQIRADLSAPRPRPAPVPPPIAYTVRGIPVYERSDHTGPLWGYLAEGEHVIIDDPDNNHLQDGRGFLKDREGLEPL